MPAGLNAKRVASLPDTGPVVMLNLMRFRALASDGSGTGWDAYLRYSGLTMPLIKARGGTIIWAGTCEGVALGDPGGTRWDYAALVRYPSRAAFLDMMNAPEYALANPHREAACEDHLILATTETYSKLGSR